MRLVKTENGLPIGHWACAHRYLDVYLTAGQAPDDEAWSDDREAAAGA